MDLDTLIAKLEELREITNGDREVYLANGAEVIDARLEVGPDDGKTFVAVV